MTPAWAERRPGGVRGRSVGVVLGGLLAAAMLAPGASPAATVELVDRTALRVCADPANLPFSNQAGEGFENRIAELLAAELGVPVRYTWYPQSTGFVRNTLQASQCDLVMGISLGFELVQNTSPYYRSAYALVYRADLGVDLRSLQDPALRRLRLGVVAGTPPASLLARHGLLANTRSYPLVVDTRVDSSGRRMIEEIARGELDVGLLWGPIAGYWALRQEPRLVVVPLKSEPGGPRLDYWITMGVRFNEPEWKRELNQLVDGKRTQIEAILRDYGVPLLDRQGEPLRR